MSPFLADSAIEPAPASATPDYSTAGKSDSFAPSSSVPEDSTFAPQLADTPNPAPSANPLLMIGAGIALLLLFGDGGNHR